MDWQKADTNKTLNIDGKNKRIWYTPEIRKIVSDI